MKKTLRVITAGSSGSIALVGAFLQGGSVTWIVVPGLIGFSVAALVSALLINLRLPGGPALYRLGVIVGSGIFMGVIFGSVMGGGPVTPGSLISGVGLIAVGSYIMWPATALGIAVFCVVDVLIVRSP